MVVVVELLMALSVAAEEDQVSLTLVLPVVLVVEELWVLLEKHIEELVVEDKEQQLVLMADVVLSL
jgi:hypothetical protein|tara:strand:- start:178 stop:375 length:198 start_codon:yes stop_codon:yes gene_type:complete